VAGGLLTSTLSGCRTRVAPRVRRPLPSERINVGVIGYGTIAHGSVANFLRDERVQVVAVADPAADLPNYGYQGERRGGRLVGKAAVEAHYRQWAGTTRYDGCRAFEDFRDMLDKVDLDAVVICAPDHWHHPATVICARRGKHIYGQKPLSLTVREGREMAEAVATAGVTFQTGSQQRSSIHFRTACEYVRNGRLGKLSRVVVGFSGGHTDWSKLASRNRPEPPPAGFNHDLWLGPAPARPYIPALGPLNWRHNWDYSGGYITDWGAHHLDIVQWALDADAGGPVRIENVTGDVPAESEIYNTARSFSFDVVYANGVVVSVSDRNRNGVQFHGENGDHLFVARNTLEFSSPELRSRRIGPGDVRLYESNLHEQNFVDCIYQNRAPIAPVEVGHRSITIAHLANIALRLKRDRLQWNPATETVIGDDAATRMLSRTARRPYRV
jgi:predicted dehydrogenase